MTIAALIVLGVAFPTGADVFYGGLAYLGDYRYVDQNYRLTVALNEPGGALDKRLREQLRERPPQGFSLSYRLADIDQSESVVLAVAVDHERVVREVFDFDGAIQTKLIVEISLQLLFYDFETQTLIDNVPVSAAVNHVIPGDVGNIDAEVARLARALYLGSASERGLLDRIADVLQGHQLRRDHGLRFQLADIEFHERVLPYLPERLEADQLQQSLGQFYSAELGRSTGVQVLPFNRGYALGNQLPGRFANGEVFGLALPEPDYQFGLALVNFVKSKDRDGLIFGAQVRFSFSEPFTNTVYVDGDYRLGVYKLASDARIVEDDWSAWRDALESLLGELVAQLKHPKKSWHTKHARDKDSYQRFNKQRGLFDG